ncbi:MAG: sigma-70 family RNA polymerase sigma factor [Bryobacterales bacterium]|nr:sigma-70 family RNA polymerase sigma factor [Bryobacterales bacterium]
MISAAIMEWERAPAVDDELDRARRRDPDALTALLMRYQHRLYRYLVRMVHDPAAAEDLFQQTWLRVIEKIGRYDPRRSFEAWLFTVARNLAIDHLRRQRTESLDDPGSPARPPVSNPDALERCLADEQVRTLQAALAELPGVYRETVSLRFEQDLKLEEIAEVVEAPLSTVKSRLRRGLEALRQKLGAGFDREDRP